MSIIQTDLGGIIFKYAKIERCPPAVISTQLEQVILEANPWLWN